MTEAECRELVAMFEHAPGWPDKPCPLEVGMVLWVTELLLRSDHGLETDLLAVTAKHRLAIQYAPRIMEVLRYVNPALDERQAATRALSILTDAECLVAEELDRRAGVAPRPGTKGAKQATEIRALRVVQFREAGRDVVARAEAPPPALSSTPWPTLTRWLAGGLRPGEMCYVGARPAVGKSAFMGQWAMHLARRNGAVLVVSHEMSNEAIARRMLAQQAQVPLQALRTGRDVTWSRVAETLHRLYDVPLWLSDNAGKLEDIVAAVELCRAPISTIFVDYLQLVRSGTTIRDRRHEVEAVSRGLKQIAMRRQIVVVALSSVSRPPAGEERVPGLAALRESGELEHDADVVLMLHRVPTGKTPQEAVCMVAKNREGVTGGVEMRFTGDWLTFGELDRMAGEGDGERDD